MGFRSRSRDSDATQNRISLAIAPLRLKWKSVTLGSHPPQSVGEDNDHTHMTSLESATAEG